MTSTQKKLIAGILFAILLVFTVGTLEKSFADTAELFVEIPQDSTFVAVWCMFVNYSSLQNFQ